jgi:GGDEF domain-containing protein
VREQTDGATASVGVAMIEPSSAGTNELLTRADRALYAVKRRGGDGHEVYD